MEHARRDRRSGANATLAGVAVPALLIALGSSASALAQDDIMPLDEALRARGQFLFNEVLLKRCGELWGTAVAYEISLDEWNGRNVEARRMVDAVLAHYGVTYDEDRERPFNRIAADALLSEGGETYCLMTQLAIGEGRMDISAEPELHAHLVASARAIAEAKP